MQIWTIHQSNACKEGIGSRLEVAQEKISQLECLRSAQHSGRRAWRCMHGECGTDIRAAAAQALKARGEPMLSSFETTPAGISAYFEPFKWQLTELLSPK